MFSKIIIVIVILIKSIKGVFFLKLCLSRISDVNDFAADVSIVRKHGGVLCASRGLAPR